MSAALLALFALAGCLPVREIADEHRALGTVEGLGYTADLQATWMAWHHPAGCYGEFLCGWKPRHDRSAVGFDVFVHGDRDRFLLGHGASDHTEWLEAPCPGPGHGTAFTEARASYEALRYEACGGERRFAYRVWDGREPPGPWRAAVVLPDRVLYAFVDGEPTTCGQALAALPPPDVWVRDRARGVCRGLEDLSAVDATRCEMREVDPRSLGVASRGGPTLGPVDAALADAVLDPAAADTTRFAPYRVRVLIDAVPDPSGLGAAQGRLEARCATSCLPWERLAASRIAARRGDGGACRAALGGIDALRAAGDDVAAAAVLVGVQGCGIDDALEPVMAALWLEAVPPIDDVWACPPEHSVSASMFCQALADVATEWAVAECPPGIVADAVRRAADPTTPEPTRPRALYIAGSCARPPAEATR